MNYALVDIGSNTIRLNVYKVINIDKELLFTKKYPTGLAQYVDDKELSVEGMIALKNVLLEIKIISESIVIDKMYIFATASLRNISNTNDVVEFIRLETGFNIEIISEEMEAYYGNSAARLLCEGEKGISVDIGGGSTEIVEFDGDNTYSTLLKRGSLNTYIKYVDNILPNKKEIDKIKSKIGKDLVSKDKYGTLIAMGGSARATKKLIGEIFPHPTEIFKVSDLNKALELLISEDKQAIKSVLKVSPERIHTIAPGMAILSEICEHYGVNIIQVASSGIREGYITSKIKEQNND